MLPDLFYHSGLFTAFNIYIIVGIIDAYLLIPENKREDPITTVPAGFRIKLPIKSPLSATRHDRLMTENP